MTKYRIIDSGSNKRREYLPSNRSPLFEELPKIDIAQEQKKSYHDFLHYKFSELLSFYFPTQIDDHNNLVTIKIDNVRYQEPEENEETVLKKNLTWCYKIFLSWTADWKCYSIQIPIQENDLEKDISEWVSKSFKINDFTLEQNKKNNNWEVNEKKGNTKIEIEIKQQTNEYLLVSFSYQQTKDVLFCHLPKMDSYGNFIINGHHKIVVFQSVRAPSIYLFSTNNVDKEKKNFYGEIIPLKGSWINFSYNQESQQIELKFLNSGRIINSELILKLFSIPKEIVSLLFNHEEVSWVEEYSTAKKKENAEEIPKFLFDKKNSYFNIGKIGRKKSNKKMMIWYRLIKKTLSEDICDKDGKIIFSKGTILTETNLHQLQQFFKQNNEINNFILPFSTNNLRWVKVNSPENKVVTVIGITEELPQEKTWFDTADLVSVFSLCLNLQEGLIQGEDEEIKDDLENQVIRRVGDLLYNIIDARLGVFLSKDIGKKYIANISQLKNADITKIPNIKEFSAHLRNFFNTSALVQLQNQNNSLSQIAYTRKVSVLGLGGFSADNATMSARNLKLSHYGRYGLVSTQEGRRFGLIQNMTIGAVINEYSQITAPYYLVKNGIIYPELTYLDSEEEQQFYITHCNININEKNEIIDDEVPVRYKNWITKVPKEKVNYIESSFFHLASVEEAASTLAPYDDPTRRTMTSNMQRGIIAPLKNEVPLVSSGIENLLYKNTSTTISAVESGQVEYADSKKIIIKEKNKTLRTYELKQWVSNKNILNYFNILVKKGDKITKEQDIACGYYSQNGELALGYNLRVAYVSYHNNFEDCILISNRLVKEDIFTFISAKSYTISRYNTTLGPEIFTNTTSSESEKSRLVNLDQEGIIKVGSKVREGDILVKKLIPEAGRQETVEEQLLLKLLGDKGQHFVDSSLYLPKGEEGTVYKVEKLESTDKDVLETVRIHVAYKSHLENGDKLVARYGNKGIIKIIPESQMPYDEEGSFDAVFGPLSLPSRMNFGQLMEVILAEAAYKLKTKFLIRPFNTISLNTVKEIAQEANIKNMGSKIIRDGYTGLFLEKPVFTGRIYTVLLNHKAREKIHYRETGSYSLIYQQPLKGRKRNGGLRFGEMETWLGEAHGTTKTLMRLLSSDDISKRSILQKVLLFDRGKFDFRYNKNESFNLVIQYLRAMGLNLEAKNYQNKKIDFYKYFSK